MIVSRHRPPRPKALIDAIGVEAPTAFSGVVWRVVTEGLDALRPARAGGRWDDGTFDVLYTSSERDGAIAESWFHAAKGQPLMPSKIKKRVFQIEAYLDRALDLSGAGKLASLGVNMENYGRLAYSGRTEEYPTLQQIAEAAHFYEYEAIVVPNARWPASNVVVFTERTRPGQLSILGSEPVNLNDWYRTTGRQRSGT